MRARQLTRLASMASVCALLAACGSSAPADVSTPTANPAAIPSSSASKGGSTPLLDWPEFGLNPQRSDSSEDATGITSANIGSLHRLTVTLPGTVDSSPIYLHGASVDGAVHNTIVVSTTYGRTLAIDADSGKILWTFTPPGYPSWAGSAQITVSSPLALPPTRATSS
jgi:glucose dehydrogenase